MVSTTSSGNRRLAIPDDPVLATLLRIESRLDNLETRLAPVLDAVDQLPGALGMAVDKLDEFGARTGDLDERFTRLMALAEKLTEPAVLDQLFGLLDIAGKAPGTTATTVDIIDAFVARAEAEGVQVDEVIKNADATVHMVLRLVQNQQLQEILRTGALEAAILGVVQSLAGAKEAVRHEHIGFFGFFRLLREPEIQMALNAGVSAARSVGSALGGSAPSKQLGPKNDA